MNALDLLRVPGLGLAAAMPSELMTEPRLDPFVADRAGFQLKRVLGVFRPSTSERAAPARVVSAGADCAPASKKDFARV